MTGPRVLVTGAAGFVGTAAVSALRTVRHTYQSERVWTAAGRAPRPAMLGRLEEYASWYEPFARQGDGSQ